MKRSGGDLITVGCAVVRCYPTENPVASGGRAPRGGSGAFTRSFGLPGLSTGGIHYAILRFIVDTTTLLNTYTSHKANRSPVGGWRPPLTRARGLGGLPLLHGIPKNPFWRQKRGFGAPPTDTGTWLGGPPCTLQSAQVSLSVADVGGWRPPLTCARGLGGLRQA